MSYAADILGYCDAAHPDNETLEGGQEWGHWCTQTPGHGGDHASYGVVTWPADGGAPPCYHPLSCRKCQGRGHACGEHTTVDPGHDRCTGLDSYVGTLMGSVR